MSTDAIALAAQMLKVDEGCELEAYPDPDSELGMACAKARLDHRDHVRRMGGQAPMTDEVPIVQWGPIRKVWKRWQVIAGILAVLVPALGYVIRVESFIQEHAKKFGRLRIAQ